MERVVTGLVQTGGWGCVSAAHALSPALVSLLSHTLVALHAALHSSADALTLQGVQVRPDAGYMCFVVGAHHPATRRSTTSVQLPDALRRVCRSVVLQPLDPTVAAEAGLRCVGLPGAAALAIELVTVLRLTAEHRPASAGCVPRTNLWSRLKKNVKVHVLSV